MPNVRETVEAIAQLDMLVVCDIQPTEITRYADVLLPEDIYLERYDDLLLGSGKTPFIGLRQPVVQSPHDTRPAWRIAKELGAELGVGDYFAFGSFEDYLDTRLTGSGTSLTRSAVSSATGCLDQLKKEGVFLPARKTPLYLEQAEEFHFHTPSGRVEFYSKQLADAGFDPLPIYKPQPEAPAASFRLLYGRSPLHTFGRTQNNTILFDLESENSVWINPRAASKLGLADGQRVLVRNARGDETGPLPAKVTERMPENAVYMVHGFGHRTPGLTRTNGRGGDDNALLEHYAVDPISGSTGMRTEFVTVHAAGAGRSS